ncbi:hypothetical protein llap_18740 [Limosa lapponica baueri]|uniref:Uncharacterized protein n=1 Tax=Limosa lapponica baueri TaxID=1758121 RepID=A0A2I0TAZ8_LIMLA|nr:hypothetical protein llap_18740 [Limosa lapponica baueri]
MLNGNKTFRFERHRFDTPYAELLGSCRSSPASPETEKTPLEKDTGLDEYYPPGLPMKYPTLHITQTRSPVVIMHLLPSFRRKRAINELFVEFLVCFSKRFESGWGFLA